MLSILSLMMMNRMDPISGNEVKNNEKAMSLNGEWQLYYGPEQNTTFNTPKGLNKSDWPVIAATVPGNVELDLLHAGVIRNPEKGSNIYELQKYETYQWWYHRTFDSPEFNNEERVFLDINGLDCLATIWLNDSIVGTTENMLIPHYFDITDFLKTKGKNELYVQIRSAVLAGRAYPTTPLEYAIVGKYEGLNIRKASHMYGWDIMPRIVSAGLWRDVSIQIRSVNRFTSVYWATQSVDQEEKNATIFLDWSFTTGFGDIKGMKIVVDIDLDGNEVIRKEYPVTGHHDKINIKIPDARFWWPRGYGDQPLYDISVKMISGNGEKLDEYMGKLGLRTVELKRSEIITPEGEGEFAFIVNGEKIFIKGTNWVPLDGFHSRDPLHLDSAIDMLVDLNCNMVRCWGGNVYESEKFYDLCDKNGILVWQDFAMGCARYPQSDDLAMKMKKESDAIIPILRNHPALALWAGNNENDWALDWAGNDENDWSPEWPGLSHIDPNKDRISRKVLPDAVRELDPFRYYLPSSPYVSPEVFKNGNDIKSMPEVHLWGPRDYYKGAFYNDVNAHFVSEIGYHGCPDRSSLVEMMDKEFVYPWKDDGTWNEQWVTKSVAFFPALEPFGRNRLSHMTKHIRILFGEVPSDLDTFIKASQSVQAEAIKFFIETWRVKKGNRSGILWWNLRDGWPIISDAVVDYYNRKKLAYWYIKRSQANVCAIIDEEKNGFHDLVIVNDTRSPSSGVVVVWDSDSKKELLNNEFAVSVNGKTSVGSIPVPTGQHLWLIEWKTENGFTYHSHYLQGKPPFPFKKYEQWLDEFLNIKTKRESK